MTRSEEAQKAFDELKKMVEDGTAEGDDSDLPELEPIDSGRTVVVFFPGEAKEDGKSTTPRLKPGACTCPK